MVWWKNGRFVLISIDIMNGRTSSVVTVHSDSVLVCSLGCIMIYFAASKSWYPAKPIYQGSCKLAFKAKINIWIKICMAIISQWAHHCHIDVTITVSPFFLSLLVVSINTIYQMYVAAYQCNIHWWYHIKSYQILAKYT